MHGRGKRVTIECVYVEKGGNGVRECGKKRRLQVRGTVWKPYWIAVV